MTLTIDIPDAETLQRFTPLGVVVGVMLLIRLLLLLRKHYPVATLRVCKRLVSLGALCVYLVGAVAYGCYIDAFRTGHSPEFTTTFFVATVPLLGLMIHGLRYIVP